jgi:RND superfamily putative drug exporter
MFGLRRLLPALILIVWLGGAAPLSALGGKLSGLQENDIAAFLPDSAESTRVQELQSAFQATESIPAVLLWENPDGIDQATLATIGERLQAAAGVAEDADALAGEVSPPIPSGDGEAVQAFLPLSPDLSDDLLPVVEDLRAAIEVDGTDSFVTGPAGIFADFSAVFEGIDGLLLLAAFGVVLIILLVVYRSPLLPLLVIATAGLALTASNAVAYLLADAGVITVNGQSQGIASILVVGAATDYGLLLVARFREELRRESSKYAAMRIALHRSWEPILASGATVVLGVLCLLLSDLGSNRGRSYCSAGQPSGRSARSTAASRSPGGAGSGWPGWWAGAPGGCSRSASPHCSRPPSSPRPSTPTASRSPRPSRASRTGSRGRRRWAGISTRVPGARRS